MPNLRFHFLHERHYAAGIEGNADVVLFHGFVPETDPVRASLYVHPPRGAHLFKALGDAACKIEFKLRYEFSSTLLARILGPVFGHIANTFVDAFVQRAEKVYGAR